MGEFYQLMQEDPAADIPRTVRRAELWLCSAERATLKAWIAAQESTRPLADPRNWRVRWRLLQSRFELWRWRGDGAAFRHPYYWAGFVLLTVHG